MTDAVAFDSRWRWLTVKQYAVLRGVHVRTVWRWIRSGLLEAERHGRYGHWRIKIPA